MGLYSTFFKAYDGEPQLEMLRDYLDVVFFSPFNPSNHHGTQFIYSELQDLVMTHMMAPTFDMVKLRSDKSSKSFFNLERCETCASVPALEDNFEFVLSLVTTFAPEQVWPAHAMFKVDGV